VVGDTQSDARPLGHPPVRPAEQAHQRRHEQGADDGGVETMLLPTVTRRLIGHVADAGIGERKRHAREQLDRLTDREREVAVAIGLGK